MNQTYYSPRFFQRLDRLSGIIATPVHVDMGVISRVKDLLDLKNGIK